MNGITKMKRSSAVALLAALSCCWLSCSQQVGPPRPDEEEFICTIDGSVWRPKVSLFSRFPLSGASYDGQTLYMGANREIGGNHLETIQISCDTVRGVGEQHIDFMRFIRDGEAYEALMPGTASVYLTTLDTVSKRVSGTFRATFVNDSGVFLKVEDGHFNFRYSGG